jgi:hypothetical protein
MKTNHALEKWRGGRGVRPRRARPLKKSAGKEANPTKTIELTVVIV